MPEGPIPAIELPRVRMTRRSVLLADRVADWTIRIGGIGAIVAVFGIIAFLAQVAAPLFAGAAVTGEKRTVVAASPDRVLGLWLDEYKTVAIALKETGEASVVHLASGRMLPSARFDFAGAQVTAFGRTISGSRVAFGFADGSIRLGELAITAQTLPGDATPAGAERLTDDDFSDGQALYSRIPGN